MNKIRLDKGYPVILFTAFLFLHIGLVTLPLYDDEGWTIAHADAILQNPLKPRVILWGESSTLSDWGKRPVWEYTYAALVYFLGQSLWLLRISKMAVGLVVLFFLYGIAKKLYDKNVAFLAALLILVNPFFVRESWFNGGYDLQMSMFYLAGLFLVLRGIYNFAGLALGLAVLTKETAVLFLPPLLLFVFLNEKKSLLKFLKSPEFLQLTGIPILLVSTYYIVDYIRYGFLFGGAETTKVQFMGFKSVLLSSMNIFGSLTMHFSLILVAVFFISVFGRKKLVMFSASVLSLGFLVFYTTIHKVFENIHSFLPLTPDMALSTILFLSSLAYLAATHRKPGEVLLYLGILLPILPFIFTKFQFPRYYLLVFYFSAIVVSKGVVQLFYGVGNKWKYILLMLVAFSLGYELTHAEAYNLFYREEHIMSGAVSGYLSGVNTELLATDNMWHIAGTYDKHTRLIGESAAESSTAGFYSVKTGYSAGPAGCKKVFEYGYTKNAVLLNDPLAIISKKSFLGKIDLNQKSTIYNCTKTLEPGLVPK